MVRMFIAHSSKDEWLINPISSNLKLIPVEPYLAKLEDPTPCPLPQKFNDAIKSSVAMFVFLTPNVAENKDTRDVVNWEIATAHAMGKPIYVFRENGVEVPLMVNYITTYFTYDPLDQRTLDEMVSRVQEIASAFKENEDKAKAAFTVIALILGGILFFGALSGDSR